MDGNPGLTKFLAFFGTLLIILVFLAPAVIAVSSYFQTGHFIYDYLMPAELFPAVLIGSLLLIWAAIRARSHRKLIIWSVAIAIIALFGGQALAVATGIASGATEPTGIWWTFVVGSLLLYDLAVIATSIGGILLLVHLFKPAPAPADHP